jgi:hypothetical protein
VGSAALSIEVEDNPRYGRSRLQPYSHPVNWQNGSQHQNWQNLAFPEPEIASCCVFPGFVTPVRKVSDLPNHLILPPVTDMPISAAVKH